MRGHSDSPHIIQVHSIRHNKRAKCPPPSAPVPPLAHCFTQTPPESQCQGVRHTGPSPEGIPTAMQSGRLPLRPRGPVPHGGEWGIKQDQRWARSMEGGEPSGRMWGLWGVGHSSRASRIMMVTRGLFQAEGPGEAQTRRVWGTPGSSQEPGGLVRQDE